MAIPNINQIVSGKNSIFNNQQKYFKYNSFGGGYNTRDNDSDVKDNELTGGQNVDLNPDTTISKRSGHVMYGNYLGNTTGILGLISHDPQGGTPEILSVYDTQVIRNSTGVALTGVTMTTNLKTDYSYFPLTSKTYIVNGTDNVVKYTSGTAGDQTDASFKKGKYIEHYKNRLIVANVNGQEDTIWYTDLGVDTFGVNNYMRTEGEITGIKVLYDRLLTFTKKRIYMTQNFTFNVIAGPEQFTPLKTDFGAIYDRSIAKVNNLIYFIGQNSKGLAGVYVTDGLNVTLISDIIRNDLNKIAPAQLVNACGTQWGRFYRFSITPTSKTTNTLEYLYDTTNNVWYPPYTSTGFSCYQTFETSGELDLYAGSQTDGRIFKLNTVDYDEKIDQTNIVVPDVHTSIDAAAGAVKRASQSFKLSVSAPRTMYMTGVALMLKKNAGTTTGLTVRIETDNAGVPSGTLAHASLTNTITAFTDTSYVWKTVKFSPEALQPDTTYHIVVQHTTEGAGNSQYYLGMKGTTSTYSNGIASAYTSSTWSNIADTDASFVIFTEGSIESFVDTKQFYLAPEGMKVHIRSMFVTAKALGDWEIECGVIPGTYLAYNSIQMNTSAIGSNWGTGVWGAMTFGSSNLSEQRLDFSNIRGRGMKFRFRNQYDNEPFTINGFTVRYHVISKFK